MEIEYRPVDEKSAREFLGWQYEPPYDNYNCPPDELDGAVEYNIDPGNNVYAMLDQNGDLVGYCSYGKDAQIPGGDYSEGALDISLMIKPALTGRGLGAAFVSEVIRNGLEEYTPKKLRVTVAAFNHRAIRVWQKTAFSKPNRLSAARMEWSL
jgi:RimJ/RimL family protein N-acetyltransferase